MRNISHFKFQYKIRKQNAIIEMFLIIIIFHNYQIFLPSFFLIPVKDILLYCVRNIRIYLKFMCRTFGNRLYDLLFVLSIQRKTNENISPPCLVQNRPKILKICQQAFVKSCIERTKVFVEVSGQKTNNYLNKFILK